MKNIIAIIAMFTAASSAFAVEQVSAVAPEVQFGVSTRMTAADPKDNRRNKPVEEDVAPSVIAMTCCSVSVSKPVAQAEEEGEGNLAMAGLGFGLAGLVGVSKLARRKKAKSQETI